MKTFSIDIELTAQATIEVVANDKHEAVRLVYGNAVSSEFELPNIGNGKDGVVEFRNGSLNAVSMDYGVEL